jgi:hypothetical protein
MNLGLPYRTKTRSCRPFQSSLRCELRYPDEEYSHQRRLIATSQHVQRHNTYLIQATGAIATTPIPQEA